MNKVTIITSEPTVIPLAQMSLINEGVIEMGRWVQSHRPDCITSDKIHDLGNLFPHDGFEDGRKVSGNELLVELAGRKCYDSFGGKAGRKTNKEYIAHTQTGEIPHRSIMYHAKFTFFLAGISRRVTHELIRNYVGSDRSEEGNPSQESTRFTHHYGWFVAPPYLVNDVDTTKLEEFERSMQRNYDTYNDFILRETAEYLKVTKLPPKGLDRKRIYEAASSYLSHSCETSLVWTTNPAALQKLFKERGDESADLEFQRLVKVWKAACLNLAPNLF